ncbi:MAG: hypothetical protein SFV24_19080 [Gemmatimonadales bacterium]|nr:hypothetical protein [Gemmatimonadales bacterium]
MAGSIVGGALIGAAVGGAKSKLSGGKFWKGAKSGAIAGGLTVGLGGLYNSGALSGITGMLPSSVQGMLPATLGGKDLWGIGNSIFGMTQAMTMQNLAREAMAGSNPFGSYRGQYGAQLAELSKNPWSITSNPGYQFGMDQGTQAIARKMAASGYAGSGNEAIALQRFGQGYAGQYLSAEQARLAGLAGANITPNYAPGLQAYAMGTDMWSRALASLGYTMNEDQGGGGSYKAPKLPSIGKPWDIPGFGDGS